MKQHSIPLRFDASPDEVFACLTDPAFVIELVRSTGSISADNIERKEDGGYRYDSVQTHFLIAIRNHLETGELIPGEVVEVISRGDFYTITRWELSPSAVGGCFGILSLSFDPGSSVLARLTAPFIEARTRQALEQLASAVERLVPEKLKPIDS